MTVRLRALFYPRIRTTGWTSSAATPSSGRTGGRTQQRYTTGADAGADRTPPRSQLLRSPGRSRGINGTCSSGSCSLPEDPPAAAAQAEKEGGGEGRAAGSTGRRFSSGAGLCSPGCALPTYPPLPIYPHHLPTPTHLPNPTHPTPPTTQQRGEGGDPTGRADLLRHHGSRPGWRVVNTLDRKARCRVVLGLFFYSYALRFIDLTCVCCFAACPALRASCVRACFAAAPANLQL